MIKTLNENDMLKFKDLSAEEKASRGILGTLFGPIASVVKSTRNGRKYSDEVWENVFSNPIVKEMLNAGGIPGELDHPIDRDETDSSRIAIMMPEAPKKDNNGHLVARFDIIDTPMGKIAAALAKYGFKFGISSRGTGDTYTDSDGNESVDPDTYDFQAFDLVLLPACEDARLKLAESFDVRGKAFKNALKEALNSATEDDRKIMEDTLTNLDIDYNDDTSAIADVKSNNIDEGKEDDTADDVGAELMKDLQEAWKKQSQLETTIRELQEKLSVCYTKEGRYSGAIKKVKGELAEAVATNKQLSIDNKNLTESLAKKVSVIERKDAQIASLREQLEAGEGKTSTLTESLATKDKSITNLNSQIKSLKESYTRDTQELKSKNSQLQEKLADTQKDAKIQVSQMSSKLEQSTKLVEKYKAIAKTAVDKYIESRASRLGLSPEDIKKSLREGYSFADIDNVCDRLQKYNLQVNALPFSMESAMPKRMPVKMSIKESVETIGTPKNDFSLIDDDVDDSLLSIF